MVTQISKIQIRRGRKENIPQALDEGEISLTLDTGELFIGSPNFKPVTSRTSYPYQNIRVLTEFDVVNTLHDNIVTTGPLMRVDAPSVIAGVGNVYSFKYNGAPATTGVVTLNWDGVGEPPSDLRGRVVQGVKTNLGSGSVVNNPNSSVSVIHIVNPIIQNQNSSIIFDVDASGLTSITSNDVVNVNFLNLAEVLSYPIDMTDTMVMDYSMLSTVMPNGLKAKRTGTLTIAADDYTVGIMDNGVTINQTSNVDMNIVWSGRIVERPSVDDPTTDIKWILLTCTNAGLYNVSITFAGTRWKHELET